MSTGQAAVFFGWEGNRRSGVALAMRRRLLWYSLRAQLPKKLTAMSTKATLL